jgi:hypothetical protein
MSVDSADGSPTESFGFHPEFGGELLHLADLGPQAVLGELPEGLGPSMASVDLEQGETDGSDSDGAAASPSSASPVEHAGVSATDQLIFWLADPDSDRWSADVSGLGEDFKLLPVAPLAQLGSAELGKALDGADFASVLEALGFDVVLVPVAVVNGVPQVAGFQSAATDNADDDMSAPGAVDLFLFSSAGSLAAFLGSSAQRLFIAIHGVAMLGFLAEHPGVVRNVVFDAAGPSPMQIPADDLGQLIDLDAPAPNLQVIEEPVDPDKVTGFELPFDDGLWAVIDLEDQERAADQVRGLVRRQTRSMGHAQNAGQIRFQLRGALDRVCKKAAGNGGQRLAFLLAGTDELAASLSVVSYWHDLSNVALGDMRLGMIQEWLVGQRQPDDRLTRISAGDTDILRNVRVRSKKTELDEQARPLLEADYWIPGPDYGHVAQISFSTPMVPNASAVLKLADDLVLSGKWATVAEPDAEDAE